MKNTLTILLALCAALVFSSIGFATTNEDDPGSAMEVTDGATTNEAILTFNFSPNVAAQYLTPGSTATEQSFTIGTYHSGGTLFYGTSSDQTITWKKDRATAQTFADAGFPTIETAEDGTETETGAAAPWDEADSGWEK